MTTLCVIELRVGRAQPFGPQGQPSAIAKEPVVGPIAAHETGLDGDEQGDTKHHGGPDKAVHAYSLPNYPLWRTELPTLAPRLSPGFFGENLVLNGTSEANVCLGDLWQIGGATLEVSQGRQPCWKLNVRSGLPDMARRVQSSGRTGWYFRVLERGQIAAGDGATLIGRPHPNWTLTRVSTLIYRDTLDLTALAQLAALPRLPDSWRRLALRRIETRQVENWRTRVETPT